jgi:polysaccharide chain length determinant protein (PEP-CTERM system associated)
MANQTEDSLNDTIRKALGIAIRRRWWILAPAFVVPLAAVAVVMHLPDQFSSEATLVVVQQQVSERYVDPASTMRPSDSVNAMTREVFSRTRLLGIIDAFGLYPKEKQRLKPDQLAERMRDDIVAEPIDELPGRTDFTAFRISFKADAPRLAQEVTSRLTSLFVEENLKTQGDQASTTTKFLTEQLEAAKRRLDQQDQRLSDFKSRNLGALPEQEQANLSALTDLRIQLQTNMANVSRAQQQRISLESTLNGNLARLLADRSALLAHLTPKHPEVVKKEIEIERTEALLGRLKSGGTVVEKPQAALGPEDPVIAQLKNQVDANVAETEGLAREEERLRTEMGQYQSRLKFTPVREQQLAGILRDYELYKQDYTELLNKQLRSQLTTNLEEQQAGRHFRLVDPPTLPALPSGPKRMKLALGAAGAGIGLGIILAFLMEMRDRSFHDEKEVKRHFGAPLVVGVPLFLTRREELSRKWRQALEWFAACALTVAVAAAEAFVFLRSGWV